MLAIGRAPTRSTIHLQLEAAHDRGILRHQRQIAGRASGGTGPPQQPWPQSALVHGHRLADVDTETEQLIQDAIGKLMNDRTAIVIAHRLSTIRNADRILVIEDGRIAEMGNHSELLREGGHYYRLYTQQFRKELEEEYDPFGEVLEVDETEPSTNGHVNEAEMQFGD